MDKEINVLFKDINSKDNNIRINALNQLLEITDNTVDWFDDVYLKLVEKLTSNNSYQRSISILLFCNLAKSDKNNKIAGILNDILIHTYDKKFITTRQCIQNIWKIAILNKKYETKIINHLKQRYITCKDEKHFNLIRQDIIQTLNEIYKMRLNEELKTEILKLIEMEEVEKYKKKYFKFLK